MLHVHIHVHSYTCVRTCVCGEEVEVRLLVDGRRLGDGGEHAVRLEHGAAPGAALAGEEEDAAADDDEDEGGAEDGGELGGEGGGDDLGEGVLGGLDGLLTPCLEVLGRRGRGQEGDVSRLASEQDCVAGGTEFAFVLRDESLRIHARSVLDR